MATDPKIVAAELAAAKAAVKAFVHANIPMWAQNFITEEEETNLAAAVVDAVDTAREQATQETKP